MTALPHNRRDPGVASRSASNPQEVSRLLARTRRDFLRNAAGVALGSTLLRSSWARAATSPSKRKVVVVTCGGGARDRETLALEAQENIPPRMRDLTPQAIFFPQVVNRGIL